MKKTGNIQIEGHPGIWNFVKEDGTSYKKYWELKKSDTGERLLVDPETGRVVLSEFAMSLRHL